MLSREWKWKHNRGPTRMLWSHVQVLQSGWNDLLVLTFFFSMKILAFPTWSIVSSANREFHFCLYCEWLLFPFLACLSSLAPQENDDKSWWTWCGDDSRGLAPQQLRRLRPESQVQGLPGLRSASETSRTLFKAQQWISGEWLLGQLVFRFSGFWNHKSQVKTQTGFVQSLECFFFSPRYVFICFLML